MPCYFCEYAVAIISHASNYMTITYTWCHLISVGGHTHKVPSSYLSFNMKSTTDFTHFDFVLSITVPARVIHKTQNQTGRNMLCHSCVQVRHVTHFICIALNLNAFGLLIAFDILACMRPNPRHSNFNNTIRSYFDTTTKLVSPKSYKFYTYRTQPTYYPYQQARGGKSQTKMVAENPLSNGDDRGPTPP